MNDTENKKYTEEQSIDTQTKPAEEAATEKLNNNSEQELAEAKKQILYLKADIDNMQRRMLKDITNQIEYRVTNITKEVLNIIDDLERCIESGKESQENSIIEGMKIIKESITKLLDHLGIEEVRHEGEFDPSIHEAISFIPSSEKHPENTIVDVMKKGYKNKQGRLIRPANIVVAQNQ